MTTNEATTRSKKAPTEQTPTDHIQLNQSKTFLVLTLGGIFYLLSSIIASPFTNMTPGELMLNFSQPTPKIINLVLLVTSFAFCTLVSFLLRPPLQENRQAAKLVTNSLTNDEKTIMDIVCTSKEITQDSLRYRLEWSKAKVSAIVSTLERMNLIQRERMGKTNNIFPSKAYTQAVGSERSGSQPLSHLKPLTFTAWLCKTLCKTCRRKK